MTTIAPSEQPDDHFTRSESVPITDIVVPSDRRAINQDKVKELAQSATEIGLLHPIGLAEDYHLVFGAHRLAVVEEYYR